MSKRELKNLAEQGSSGCVQHRLRSGKSRGSLSVMEGGNQTETVGTADPHVSDDVQELREKLQMAQEELEIVRARLAQQLAAAGEAAALAEQLKRAQQTAEAAAVEGAERRRAEDAESQLDRLARESEELQRRVFETEETARAEVEATRMRLELEGLRQLEEVRRQFDKERDRYQREHDQDATLIADLRTLLQDGTTRRPTGGPERELQAPGESVAASAPLHGGVEHCETTEGSWVGDRSVSFTVGTPGVLGPPVSQAAHTVDTSIGTGGPVSLVGVGSSVASVLITMWLIVLSVVAAAVVGNKEVLGMVYSSNSLPNLCRLKQPWWLPKLEPCRLRASLQSPLIAVKVKRGLRGGLTSLRRGLG